MWKDDEPEPFVGKIIKIWEDKTKKVKILWFFKPSEIFNCLDDAQTSENELILGSGEGPGLSNINPLEVIAGKCNVICISKDDRNPQPTNEELQGADYVFYRIFDVKQLTISENIPDTIAAIDIKCIFNRREGQQPSVSTTPGTENLVSNDVCGSQTENGDRFNYHNPSEGKSNAVQKSDAVMNSHLQDKDDDNELYGRPFKKPKLDSSVNLPREKTENDLNVRSDGTISPKSAGDEKANVTLDVSNDIVSKALKVETHVVAGEIKGKSKLARESNATDVVLPKERKLDEEVRTLANGEIPTDSNQMLNKQEKLSSLIMEVTRSPGADKKGWFRQLPWEERMENAHQQGALVLLENLDPSYTSDDVRDIIHHGFKESCTAKIVYHTTNCSPLSGQAFVIFKTKEAAEKVVTKLEHECLMLSNGRPLIASFRNPCFPGKETLIGYFGIDKLKVQSTREKKEAVPTSHCSQPNSIEYEFAMDWCLLQERSKWRLKNLHKQQAAEVKEITAELKTKLTYKIF
uniref:BAH domain-containing protein n=1 Tax=Kalanchoe fedtschenkoi TaxID=63787 RepID=A0A7N0TMT9_KALFE